MQTSHSHHRTQGWALQRLRTQDHVSCPLPLVLHTQASIAPWALTWRFSAGERTDQTAVRGAGVMTLSGVQTLQGTTGTDPAAPQAIAVTSSTPLNSSGLLFSFLGIKGGAGSWVSAGLA